METMIRVNHVHKKYQKKIVLKDVSLAVQKGEVFGLLGKNGAGKSTLIDCLLGIKAINGGQSYLLEADSQNLPKKIFERIGVQFQASHHPDKIRVAELCKLTSAYYQKPAAWQKLLAQLELLGKEKQFVHDLSGGERQKLSVLLTLIPSPKLIFLDELTTGLDTLARRQVWQLLLSLKEKGLTIFLTSHYMDEVEVLCDRVSILQNGEVSVQGTPQEIIQRSGKENLEEAYLWYTEEENDHEQL